MYNLIKLNKKDNVAVAPMNIPYNTKKTLASILSLAGSLSF